MLLHCPLGRFHQFPVGKMKRKKVDWKVDESWSVDFIGLFDESYGAWRSSLGVSVKIKRGHLPQNIL